MQLAPLSILLIEGDPVVRYHLCRQLRATYHLFGAVGSGEAGLLRIPREGPRPDLVVIGRCTECCYGQNTTIRLLRKLYDLPVLVLCSSLPAHVAQKGVWVLRKPFARRQLVGALAAMSSSRLSPAR